MSISKEKCMKVIVVWAEKDWGTQTLYCNNCSRASDRMMELVNSQSKIITILNLDMVARLYIERYEVDEDE